VLFDIEGTPVYVLGDSPKVLLYFTDIFGLDGGKTPKLLEDLVALGYCVVAPDCLNGEVWKDDAPVGPECFAWIKSRKPDPVEKFVVETLLPLLKKLGKKEFAVVGSCYGSWMALRAASLCKEFKAGVHFHPSFQIEGFFSGDIKNVAEKVTAPQIIFAAGNDLENVKPGGEIIKLLTEKTGGKCESYLYETEVHGFMNRADHSNAVSKKVYDEVLKHTKDFLAKYF